MKKIPVRQLSSTQQKLPPLGQFKVRSLVEILQGKDLLHGLHRHSFFFILAVQKGTGRHEIDFTNYEIHDNSVFCLRPGQVHELELKGDSTGYLLEFDAEFYSPKDKSFNQLLRKVSHKNYCAVDINRFNKLLSILSSVLEEYVNREESYQEAIKSSLDLFFIQLVRQSPHPKHNIGETNSYTQERFEEFLDLLEKYMTTHKQISHYTDLMSLSAYQLNEITKSSINKTAFELINEHIILEAKRYLLATANQVKDIAGQLGYEDTSYFIRFFKKHTSHSPEAFRDSFK